MVGRADAPERVCDVAREPTPDCLLRLSSAPILHTLITRSLWPQTMVVRYSQKVRNDVTDLIKAGTSDEDIIKQTGISSRTLRCWRRDVQYRGVAGGTLNQKPGRPAVRNSSAFHCHSPLTVHPRLSKSTLKRPSVTTYSQGPMHLTMRSYGSYSTNSTF